MMRYPFPRARGDAESAARLRATVWRALAVAGLFYIAGIGWLIWHLVK